MSVGNPGRRAPIPRSLSFTTHASRGPSSPWAGTRLLGVAGRPGAAARPGPTKLPGVPGWQRLDQPVRPAGTWPIPEAVEAVIDVPGIYSCIYRARGQIGQTPVEALIDEIAIDLPPYLPQAGRVNLRLSFGPFPAL